jgi:hypothetical protein
MLYMDEIFGFFPPVANPPAKAPLLTLLKQGRAAGLGVVLATQNPVDLDYKGLSNIGTWWLGRLQTERDKARVIDGLEGASESGAIDRAEVERLLSSLSPRVFLMRNVHDDRLTLFESRWALSYLRGPLSRDEIKSLSPAPVSAAADRPAPPAKAAAGTASGVGTARPVIPPEIPQFFSPDAAAAVNTPLRAVLYGAATVRFVDPKRKIDTLRLVTRITSIGDGAVAVDWSAAQPVEWPPESLEHDAPEGATFASPPSAAFKAKNYDAWTKQFAAVLSASEALELFESPSSGALSAPDEAERDFRARQHQTSREERDRALEALRRKYAPRQAALDEKLRRARQAVERESDQATGQKLQTAISVGATLMGALLGKRAISASTIGRATTAARGLGRTMKESEDIERAKETLAAIEEQQRQLEADLRTETAALDAANDAATEKLERVVIKPKKTNVTVKIVALVWTV